MLNNRFKKYLACLLTIAMICGSVVFPVMAEEGDAEVTEETTSAIEEPETTEEEEEADEVSEDTVDEEPAEEAVDVAADPVDVEEPEEPEEEIAEEILDFCDAPYEYFAAPEQTRGVGDIQYDEIFARLTAACEAWDGSASFSVDVENLGLTTDNYKTVAYRFKNEHNKYFFVQACGGSYYPSSGKMAEIELIVDRKKATGTDYHGVHQLSDVAEFEAKVNEILSGIDPLWSDVEKLLYFHDYIVTHCDYDVDAIKTGTAKIEQYYTYDAYGCLVMQKCVCEGYSRAFDYLCERAGISCNLISSEVNCHMWNYVTMSNGNSYYVDCTNDDPVSNGAEYPGYAGYCSHNYFLNSYSTIAGTNNHTAGDWQLDDWDTGCESNATDTSYDEYFWRTDRYPGYQFYLRSAFIPVGDNKWVVFRDEDKYSNVVNRTLQVYDFKTETRTEFTFLETSITPAKYSALAKYGDDLILASGDNIYQIVLSSDKLSGTAQVILTNSTTTTGFDPSTTDFQGVSVAGNTLSYVIYSSQYVVAGRGSITLPLDNVVKGKVTGCSLTLDGTIGINFYLQLPHDYSGTVMITGPQGDKTFTTMPDPDINGNYIFTYSVESDEMADEVTLSLSGAGISNANCAGGYEYSVNTYITKAQDYYSTNQKLQTLLTKISVYGECSSKYFHGVGSPEDVALDLATLDSYQFVLSTPGSGISYYGSSLSLNAMTDTNHYFTVASGTIDDYKFFVDGNEAEVTAANVGGTTRYKLKVSGITAANLDVAHVITIKSGNTTVLEISNYSALSYVRVIRTSSRYGNNKDLVNLVNSLYYYNDAANAYANA